MAKKKRLVLTDPRAIRALAHPARQVIIDELYSGKVLTATECAELAGLTPSATSYHLRALERWGIVERADTSTDGRERPWRAPAQGLEVSTQSGGAGRIASQTMIRNNILRVLEQFEELAGDDPWDDLSKLNRSRLWLTRAETEQLDQELTEVIDRYRKGRTATNHPAATRQISTLLVVVPTGKAPEES
ncbi:MAG TPA: winged helix-turn-helix domain-containing protein [Kribbella sp.]|uniref:winged helix-turn-helix domain-containing protein n=1 Tax=Kribbella sp. TaxID=1871183 RepID=UPI002D788B46|nr:winged helix-turn-helix domain-containing protein [Kribbella sp.]HET6298017.1 winged helix-turn-helix domain-containing protein [Kribbella sp.]